jgi:penicillin-binding protein 1A
VQEIADIFETIIKGTITFLYKIWKNPIPSLIVCFIAVFLIWFSSVFIIPWMEINYFKISDYRSRVEEATSNIEMQKNPPIRMININNKIIYDTVKSGFHDQNLNKISKTWNTLEDEYPKSLASLIVLSEDKDFYNHDGISNWDILRAIVGRGKKGSGSTITQQIARKTVKMDFDKISPFKDKIEEQTVAKLLEEKYTKIYSKYPSPKPLVKEAILLQYMNQVNLGTNVYGFKDAARVYFGKPPQALSLGEQVKLVVMLSEPENYTCPQSNGKTLTGEKQLKSLEKINIKSKKLAKNLVKKFSDSIDKKYHSQFNFSSVNEAKFTDKNFCSGINEASYFTRKVKNELKEIIQTNKEIKEIHKSGGLSVNVTLDKDKQRSAADTLTRNINRYKSRYGVSEGAIILMETNTGKVRAMFGISSDENNSAILQARPPASTFKMFTYLTALEAGISPNDLYSCKPFQRPNLKEKDKCSKYGSTEKISLFQALAGSENVITWRIASSKGIGIDNVIKTAEKLTASEKNIDALDNSFEGIIGQGNTRVSFMKMIKAYSTIANEGIEVNPEYIERIFDTKKCKDLSSRYKECGMGYKPQSKKTRKVKSSAANTLTKLLQGVIHDDKGTGKLAQINPKSEKPETKPPSLETNNGGSLNDINSVMREAGKTGTNGSTNDAKDLWFIGYVPSKSIIAGVWLSPGPLPKDIIKSEDLSKAISGNLAAKVWGEFITAVAPELKNNTSAAAREHTRKL